MAKFKVGDNVTYNFQVGVILQVECSGKTCLVKFNGGGDIDWCYSWDLKLFQPQTEQNKYWMVNGAGVTASKYTTYEAAVDKAKQLAQQNPGINFQVLQSVDDFLVPKNEMIHKKI